ncbi:MAG: CapA family protein, partial [Anaerolineales bacterium]
TTASATNTPLLISRATRESIHETSTPTTPPLTTLLFTGVIVPARCVQAALDKAENVDYPYDEVRSFIQNANLAIGTFNATMSDIAPHTGCVSTYVLVGSPGNADALARAGFDAMSVATNHIKDCGLTTCGDQAFFDTLENLHRVGIQTVGAGKNADEALEALLFNIHGVRFAILSQGQIEQGGVYATNKKAGIAPLTEENIHNAIQAARKEADVVIFMPHWGPEDSAIPNWIQRNLAHIIVAEGADLVVGNHTHVVQGYQKINETWVFYGLGNFLFDQWQRDHQQGVMLLIRFQGTQMIDFQWIPIHVDKSGRIHLADATESAEILQRIENASKNLR